MQQSLIAKKLQLGPQFCFWVSGAGSGSVEAAHAESIAVQERKRRHGAGLMGVTGYSGQRLEAGSVALLIDEARYCVPHPHAFLAVARCQLIVVIRGSIPYFCGEGYLAGRIGVP